MKKNIFLIICALFITVQPNVFADEIIQSDGTIIQCKIETVMEGFIEYKQNGILNSFTRVEQSPIFADYVIVKDKLFNKECVTRHNGHVAIKNLWSTTLLTFDNKYMEIPFYKIKSIGIYKP